VALHSDFPVYIEDPKPYLPEQTKKPDRTFTRYRTDATSIEAKAFIERMNLGDQPVLKLRDTTRGPLKVRALCIPVYVWDGECSQANRFFVLATQGVGATPQTKISLYNAQKRWRLKDRLAAASALLGGAGL
jgi:hypothetical protein